MKNTITVTVNGNTYTAKLISAAGKKLTIVFNGMCRTETFSSTDTPAIMQAIVEQELANYIKQTQAGKQVMQWKPCPTPPAE